MASKRNLEKNVGSPPKKDKMLRIFTEKGMDYFLEVDAVVKKLIAGRKPLEIQREMEEKGLSVTKAREMIIRARGLLKKNLTNIAEKTAVVNSERYRRWGAKFLDWANENNTWQEAWLIAAEQEEVLNGLHSKNKITIINNNAVEQNTVFEPQNLSSTEQAELGILLRKGYLLKHG